MYHTVQKEKSAYDSDEDEPVYLEALTEVQRFAMQTTGLLI